MRGHLWKAAMPLAAPRSSFSFVQIVAAFRLTCSSQAPTYQAGRPFLVHALAQPMLGCAPFTLEIHRPHAASTLSTHSPFCALLCTQRSTGQQFAIAIHTHMQAAAHYPDECVRLFWHLQTGRGLGFRFQGLGFRV